MQRLLPLRRVLLSCASAVEGAAKAASAHEYQIFRLFAGAHEGPPKEAVSAIPFKVPTPHGIQWGTGCSYSPLSWLDAHWPAQARRCRATKPPRRSCSTTAPTPCLCSPPQVCVPRPLLPRPQAARAQADWQRVLSAEKVKESYLPFWVTTAHVEVELRWADCGCALSLLGAPGRPKTHPTGS